MNNTEVINSCYEHKNQGDVLLAGYRLELAVGLMKRLVEDGQTRPTAAEVKTFLALDTEPLTARDENGGPRELA